MTRSLKLIGVATAMERSQTSEMKSPQSIDRAANSQEEERVNTNDVNKFSEGGFLISGVKTDLSRGLEEPSRLIRKYSLRRELSNPLEYQMGCVRANFTLEKFARKSTVRFSRELKSANHRRVPSMLLPTVQTRMFPDLAEKLRASGRPSVIPYGDQTSLELSTRSRSVFDEARITHDPDRQSSRVSVISRLLSISSTLSSLSADVCSDTLPIQEGRYLDTFASVTSAMCAFEERKRRTSTKDTNQEQESSPFDDIECPECRRLLQERGRMDKFVEAWLSIVVSASHASRRFRAYICILRFYFDGFSWC